MRVLKDFMRTGCLLVPLAVAGCDLAPAYHTPHMVLPASYQGSGPFTLARPQDQLPRGPWWQAFNDPTLDGLERRLQANNPDMKAAAEAYTQARDLAGEARAGLLPQLSAGASLSDNKQSLHRLFRASAGESTEASNMVDAAATWEPDFWSKIRNQTKMAKENAQSMAAQVASAQLSLEAELASDYMGLRGLDSMHAVYTQSIATYKTAISITSMRENDRIASGLDVARAENQLASAQALDTATLTSRALMQHAIAVLIGVTPSDFVLPFETDANLTDPVIPVGVPSELLQRRPDIAAAERTMAAASAGIGVSRAAFYPDFSLSVSAGFEDNGFDLASLPNSFWALGTSAVLPLFEGGLRKAELQRTWSQFAQTSDNYKSTVLAAFQQVEDGLSLTTMLAIQARQQETAVRAAVKAEDMTLSLYKGGLENYLDVTVSQVYALTAQIAEVQVQTQRLQAAVGLIRALGGGWNTNELPTADQTLPFDPLSTHASPGDVHTPS
ncbi:MAG TPA: efflux transporter outer membrane subunit [Rhodopila sp.]